VDQFVVKALREVTNLPESKTIAVIDENNIQPQEGAVLIEIMQRKARELNELFRELFWTPRKIDMILWTFGRNTNTTKFDEPTATHRRDLRSDKPKIRMPSLPSEGLIKNHDMIAHALKNYRGMTLTTSDISKFVLAAFPHFELGSLLPNDHAQGNKSACRCAGSNNQIFDKIERGKYRVR
jgi:hypothetical protein